MKIKKLEDLIFDVVTYINGVLATYEDKIWLRANIILEEDFFKRARLVGDVLYIETI